MQGFTDNYIRVKQAPGTIVDDNIVTQVNLGELTDDKECLMSL